MDNWHRVSVDHAKLFYTNAWPSLEILPDVFWNLNETVGPGRVTDAFGADPSITEGLSWIWKTEGSVLSDVCVYAFYFKDKDKAAWFKLTYG